MHKAFLTNIVKFINISYTTFHPEVIAISEQFKSPLVKPKYFEYMDILRILATFAVVFLHVSSQNRKASVIDSFNWYVFNIQEAGTRWAVPVFVMISGAVFLGRKQPIEKLYKKNIFRILTALIFWSGFYAIAKLITSHDLQKAAKQFITGNFHQWFLFMIIGLYMIVPFLNKIVESKKLTEYFLLIYLVLTIVLPHSISLFSLYHPFLGSAFKTALANMNYHFALGYSGYFVLGYYLNNIKISEKAEKIIYALGVLGYLITAFGTIAICYGKETENSMLFTNTTPNVFMMALAVFVFGKMRLGRLHLNGKSKATISRLSKYSFGIYLIHPFIIDEFRILLNFTTVSFNPLLSVPVLFLAVSIISLALSAAINHIPYLSKYIV